MEWESFYKEGVGEGDDEEGEGEGSWSFGWVFSGVCGCFVVLMKSLSYDV